MLALGSLACQPQTAMPIAEAAEGFSEPGPAAENGSPQLLKAGFLVVDGVYNTELTAPFDVLDHSVYHLPKGQGIDAFTVSPDGDTVTTAEGLRIVPDFGFEDAPPIDILVVPSAEGSRDRDLDDEDLIAWVAAAGGTARYVVSLCWGAFVLAQAGLLEDVASTTFPSDYDSFSTRFPELDLRVNVSFVHDGRVITSQGGARSFDAAMHLVDLLYGEQVAKGIGRGLLIPWPPTAESDLSYISRP